MCNKNTPNFKTNSMINKGTTVSLKPARKTRTKTRKPKFLSLRLDISQENSQQSDEMTHHHQLNLFPLHPENLVEDKDMHDENMAYFFDPEGGATLNGLLEVKNETTVTGGGISPEEDDSLTYAYGRHDREEGAATFSLERAALRNKERDASEEKWVCYSEVVEKKEEEVTSCAADIRYKNKMQGLSLKLDYEEILNAWSDKGPLYIEGECPQTVPDMRDDFLAQDSATVLMDGWGSVNGSAGLWRVPEIGGNVNVKSSCIKMEEVGERERMKMGQREASVLRYKEKRQSRLFSKRIRYEVRKLNAQKRPRMKVTWAGFDKLEIGPSAFKHVLLLGYQNGFQVLDVEDASNFSELVSKRDGPVTFLQMQPIPAKSDGHEGFRISHPLLLVVAGDEISSTGMGQNRSHLGGLGRDANLESQSGNCVNSPTAVRFYSLRSHSYVHVLRFRSAVCMVRCGPRIVAVGLTTQIYCFDALTLENKFSVLTYPVPQLGGHGTVGINIGYGPMAVGPRWLAYASNNPLLSNTGRLSPQNLTPSPGVSPSTSPGSGSLVARYAMESSKQLAAGIINLGDMGYKTLSKYCQELLPDGSNSPVSSSSGWKVGRLSGTETDNAGMVVVKDFVSRAVISQFRAHTSPISALCFDPSGTLLVTASVYGNNINIFRIMPSCTRSGSGTQSYDWSSSHVHLYKLYRGITTAIIQDICFSHYSQWIAIVSSKGTCHIFFLSPFGGDAGFQTLNFQGEEPSLFPAVSLPWWSTSSCIINQQSYPPPAPVALSVVSRIRNSNSGWLNTVSNAAASATGKVSVPSGAVAAVFHNSISHSLQHVNKKVNSLEHLLVYTPSGHVIQHELLPSTGTEPSDSASRIRSGSLVQIQDEELRVKVEPIQWWDVCRRLDWPEREECVSVTTLDGQEAAELILDKSDCVDSYRIDLLEMRNNVVENKLVKPDLVKPHERSNLYLSNAEIQISSGRLPIWQKSKICFYTMDPLRVNSFGGGEFEIEKVTVHEVEIKRKDLLPVFDHFHSIKSGWNDRGLAGGRYPIASTLEPHQAKGKFTEETVICHSKPASLSSTESSDGGSSRRIENLFDLDQIHTERHDTPNCQIPDEFSHERGGGAIDGPYILNLKPLTTASIPSELSKNDDSHADYCIRNGLSSLESNLPSAGGAITERVPSSSSGGLSEVSMLKADHFDSTMNVPAVGHTPPTLHNPVDFGPCFQEGYCNASDLDGCCRSDVVTNDLDSSSSNCEREKPEDGENDEMFGGIFAFSEEG